MSIVTFKLEAPKIRTDTLSVVKFIGRLNFQLDSCGIFRSSNVSENLSSVLFKTEWYLYAPYDVTLRKSAFCRHSVFVCSLLLSQYIQIISLNSTNRLIFIMGTGCVLCQVENEFLCNIYMNAILQRHAILPFFVICKNSIRYLVSLIECVKHFKNILYGHSKNVITHYYFKKWKRKILYQNPESLRQHSNNGLLSNSDFIIVVITAANRYRFK
jgi:hypothetical protein